MIRGKVFRTRAPEVGDNEDVAEADKVVIYTPDNSEEMENVRAGNLDIKGGPQGGISFVDPRGVEWDDQSPEVVAKLIESFLASDAEWLELQSPMNGTLQLLRRDMVESVWLIQASRIMLRKDLKQVKVPRNLRLERAPANILQEIARNRRPG